MCVSRTACLPPAGFTVQALHPARRAALRTGDLRPSAQRRGHQDRFRGLRGLKRRHSRSPQATERPESSPLGWNEPSPQTTARILAAVDARESRRDTRVRRGTNPSRRLEKVGSEVAPQTTLSRGLAPKTRFPVVGGQRFAAETRRKLTRSELRPVVDLKSDVISK